MTDFPILETLITCANLGLVFYASGANRIASKVREESQIALSLSQARNKSLREQSRLLSIYRESEEPASCKLKREGKTYTLYIRRLGGADNNWAGIVYNPNGSVLIPQQDIIRDKAKFKVIDFVLMIGNDKPCTMPL